MRKIRNFFLIYVAYNEENSLLRSFLHSQRAIDFCSKKYGFNIKADVVICHNGCTDKTPLVASLIKNRYSNKNISIDVISSPRGMVIAQNQCIKYIKEKKYCKNLPLIFIDADSCMKEDVIFGFLEQFRKHPHLKAIGAQPMPIPYKGWNPIKILLDKILNCRAYFPETEITIRDSARFHPYRKNDPQNVGQAFEKKSRIYFHGRCFALKNTDIWDVPADRIGEDTYLNYSIHERFGPGSIRLIYDLNVKYLPIVSLDGYFKTYYRIFKDIDDLKKQYPHSKKWMDLSKTKLDWLYIKKLPICWQIIFVLHFILKEMSQRIFKYDLIYRNKTVQDVWSYKHKTQII